MRKLDCQFGIQYFKEKGSKDKLKRTVLQGTCKIGCMAHIVVHSIILYTDFQIPKTSGLTTRKLKEKKKELLHSAINENKLLNTIKIFHVLLPGEETHHSFHPTQEVVLLCTTPTSKNNWKIYELVNDGITEVQEVKRALKAYVTHVMCSDCKPDVSYY